MTTNATMPPSDASAATHLDSLMRDVLRKVESRPGLTVGELRRRLQKVHGSSVEVIQDAVDKLLARNSLERLPPKLGQRSYRYAPFPKSPVEPPRIQAVIPLVPAEVVRTEAPPHPAALPWRPRVEEQTVVSRLVASDFGFAAGNWFPIERVQAATYDFFPNERSLGDWLKASQGRFELRFGFQGQVVSVRLRGAHCDKYDYR